MAIGIKLYQDNREKGTHLFYGKAHYKTTVDIEFIAKQVQANCSAKIADVKACLVEMVQAMSSLMQNSYKVKMGTLGTFYVSVHSTGAESDEAYTCKDNVTGFKVNYQPHTFKQNGVFVNYFTADGVQGYKIS